MNKLYKLLRMPDDSALKELDAKMSAITGKTRVIKEIEEENEWRLEKAVKRFGLDPKEASIREVRDALLGHLKKSEDRLNIFLGGEDGKEFTNFESLIKHGHELMNPKKLWVLKKEKFREILEGNPPPNIMKKFGYKDGKELFDKENLLEVANSLRFMESKEWMHETFDKAYGSLTPDDFEEREAEVVVLSGKWLEVALPFVEKKRHNLSHLKELGLVFIIPIEIKDDGELIRVFALYLHYLYEVQFYSDLFKGLRDGSISSGGRSFPEGVISLLRGDILDSVPAPSSDSSYNWLIIQRYLAKEDRWGEKLFTPHVNPEAIHWGKAEEALTKLDKEDLSLTFGLWLDLDWVGGYFKEDEGAPLVSPIPDGERDEADKNMLSFDLIDTVMGLVMEEKNIKYLYHQQEALWNRIFEGYMGDEDKLEKMIIDNLLKGYIELP